MAVGSFFMTFYVIRSAVPNLCCYFHQSIWKSHCQPITCLFLTTIHHWFLIFPGGSISLRRLAVGILTFKLATCTFQEPVLELLPQKGFGFVFWQHSWRLLLISKMTRVDGDVKPYSFTCLSGTAPCGFQGCKNRPAPFPGRVSYKASKPGCVCPVS